MADRPTSGGDPPANQNEEIEVTPAMIEAGKREVCRFNPDYDDPADVASNVFRLMLEASRISSQEPRRGQKRR